jgi:hypothetical protein
LRGRFVIHDRDDPTAEFVAIFRRLSLQIIANGLSACLQVSDRLMNNLKEVTDMSRVQLGGVFVAHAAFALLLLFGSIKLLTVARSFGLRILRSWLELHSEDDRQHEYDGCDCGCDKQHPVQHWGFGSVCAVSRLSGQHTKRPFQNIARGAEYASG